MKSSKTKKKKPRNKSARVHNSCAQSVIIGSDLTRPIPYACHLRALFSAFSRSFFDFCDNSNFSRRLFQFLTVLSFSSLTNYCSPAESRASRGAAQKLRIRVDAQPETARYPTHNIPSQLSNPALSFICCKAFLDNPLK